MIERRTLWAMAVGCGLSVANLYYVQPLLAMMGRSFGVDDRRMGLVAMLSQVGYGLGMLLFVPLGDRLERRGFILTTLGDDPARRPSSASPPRLSFGWLAVASLAVGITTVAPQLLVPFAAHLAGPAERGRVVGTVMSGLLIGVLGRAYVQRRRGRLIRVAGGPRDGRRHVGRSSWRSPSGALGCPSRRAPEAAGTSYLGLLRSIGGLLREEPVLRQSCFSRRDGVRPSARFWTSRSVPPHPARRSTIRPASSACSAWWGSVGAWPAPLAGRLADRQSPFARTIGAGSPALTIAYALLGLSGNTLAGLVAGVILLDLGAQATHISNQSRIYAIRPEARSRMNTAYMVAYFIGGATGSYAGAWGWSRAGWVGVCVVGLAMTAAGLLAFAATSAAPAPRKRAWMPAAERPPG